jgi:hypothetical protein
MRRATRPSRGLQLAAISSLVGFVAAFAAFGTVGRVSTAATHVFVDMPPPSAVHGAADPVSSLVKRAELLGRVVTSPVVVERIGRIAGVPQDDIGTYARTYGVEQAFTEVQSEERASDIQASSKPYRIEVQARQDSPVLDIYTRAPSTAGAERLANAAFVALDQHLRVTADQRGTPARFRVDVRQLQRARGGVVNRGMATAVAAMAFLVAFALSFVALHFAAPGRARADARAREDDAPEADDDWPHTTRVLPWMFACFLAVLWLVPFNDIQLNIHFPIDLKLDRLILPFVVAAWAIALLVGGRAAPRLRPTAIHFAVGAFVLCAFASVIVNADALSRDLELDGSLKQLPSLVAFASLFVIASTAVRAREVRPFLTYTLVLGVICAIEMIWEYRFGVNLFYDWSDKLLPSFFSVQKVDATAVDDLGRRLVRGPASVPLEAVAMLAMALPVALVRLTTEPGWRKRLLYALAVCLLLAAALATNRKSALLGPIAVILTVAYFRRRELLKLAPLALVLLVVVHVLAPGTLGKTTRQFDPSALGVSTVSDRSADYDAIRPDLWTHPLLGRGWGGYPRLSYRTLDSQILGEAVEMGMIGMLAYVLMIGSVIAGARATIARRDPTWAPMALMGAAAAMSFLVMSFLFDVIAFPHATYIFLYMAGLVAVVISQRGGRSAPVVRRRQAHRLREVAHPAAQPAGLRS